MEKLINKLLLRADQLEEARREYKDALLKSKWITQFPEYQWDKMADAAVKVVETRTPLVVRYDALYQQYMVVGSRYTHLGEYDSQEAAEEAIKYFM